MAIKRQGGSEFEEPAIAALLAGMPRLSSSDREALSHLRVVHRFVGRGRTLIREAQPVSRVRILCKGWAIRSRVLDKSRRQILDFALPGDILGLHVDGFGQSICDVVALTPCEVGEIDTAALDRVALQNRGVSMGLLIYLARQLTQANDQLLRLGRMTAYERVCSFLLEIYARQRHTAKIDGTVDFPVTQTIVADLLGLSVVHVNRQVMRLRREGLVTLSRRQLKIHDAHRLAELARFRDRRFEPQSQSIIAAE